MRGRKAGQRREINVKWKEGKTKREINMEE
jgi:hypothetical protein